VVLERLVSLNIDGFSVGCYESEEAESGITVVFAPDGNTAGMSQMGRSPGTRETDMLRPFGRPDSRVNAIALVGRSVFGLRAVEGLVWELYLRGEGIATPALKVPIVPAAVVYDFFNNTEMPDEEWGKMAYQSRSRSFLTGRHGAGRGATIGKALGRHLAQPSGQGYHEVVGRGVTLGVLVVVNSFGWVFRPGADTPIGYKGLRAPLVSLLENGFRESPFATNTTLAVVITDAVLSKVEACIVAERVNSALYEVIKPFNTSYDGDVIFVVASNKVPAKTDYVSLLAQTAAQRSVLSVFTF
jgi:L-aminopeptidase/D-esterase-like protein